MENLPLDIQIELAEHAVLCAQNHLNELLSKQQSQVKFMNSAVPGAIYGMWGDKSTTYYYPNTAENHPNCNPPPLSGRFHKETP